MSFERHKPIRILVPDPPMGGKPFLIRRKGMFVLEEGPGMLQTFNITHAGSGDLIIADGVPDPNGYFPDENIPEDDPLYTSCNGRPFVHFSPVYMGAWMMNAGFRHGLTVWATGGRDDVPPFISLVWQAQKTRTKSALPIEQPEPESLMTNEVKDVKVPAFSHSLMRSVNISRIGATRISRRISELYSMLVTHNGAFTRIIARNGKGVPIFDMFSAFTGSFVMGAFTDGGIIVDVEGRSQAPLIQVNFREPDLALV